MASLETLEADLGRRLRGVLGPLVRGRRHRATLRRGAVTEAQRRAARATWWGHEPHWYPDDTPPRRHNRVTPLVDGEHYFAALLDALAGARDYVYVVGWCLTPEIPLRRVAEGDLIQTRLLTLLAETARRLPVRVLLWAGAPVLLQPTTRTAEAVQRAVLAQAGDADLRCELDRSAHITHCLHQKTLVVDGQVAFVGGMDLTTFQGDRWDTQAHRLRPGPNWHDVQVRIEGEAVADVEHNFRQRWRAVTGDEGLPHREPAHEPVWDTPTQIVRTIPRDTYGFAPQGEFGILHAYTRAIRLARRFIYLENQYLWSPHVMDALIEVIDQPHDEPFRLVLVLPAHAYSGKWDNDRHVQRLREVDRGRGIVSVYCPYTSGVDIGTHAFTFRPTYVHAKVAIFDDEWLMVGSANLNNRGLITDGELNALVHDPALARALRVDLWAEHLALPAEWVAGADPVALIDGEWAGRAAENAAIVRQTDRPLICALHPYQIGRMPGAWVLEEAEVLTFDR